jgi:hypothetical protein
MSLILGILAQSAGAAGAANSYESIATVTVGSGGVSNVEFTSIANTWEHLQIRALIRTTHASGTDGDYVKMQFNSDTGSNYATHYLYGNGTSATASAFTSQTSMFPARVGATGLSANIFGVLIIDVLDYDNTNKYKTIRNLGGYDANGSGRVDLDSGLWMSTSAVTSIKFTAGSGTGFEQYSQFALYGIKGV